MMSHPMIDNPRFRGMTLDEARDIEKASRGFRDLSDEQVWALRKVYAHDCTQRAAEPDPAAALVANLEQLDKMFPGHVRALIGPDLCDRLLAALAERPAEPDPESLIEVARTVELCALDVRDGKAAPEDTRATLVDDLLSAVATLRGLAEPVEPDQRPPGAAIAQIVKDTNPDAITVQEFAEQMTAAIDAYRDRVRAWIEQQ